MTKDDNAIGVGPWLVGTVLAVILSILIFDGMSAVVLVVLSLAVGALGIVSTRIATWVGGGLLAAVLSVLIFDGIPAVVLVVLSLIVGALGALLVWAGESD
jgi:hypothetical protein